MMPDQITKSVNPKHQNSRNSKVPIEFVFANKFNCLEICSISKEQVLDKRHESKIINQLLQREFSVPFVSLPFPIFESKSYEIK